MPLRVRGGVEGGVKGVTWKKYVTSKEYLTSKPAHAAIHPVNSFAHEGLYSGLLVTRGCNVAVGNSACPIAYRLLGISPL